MSLLNALFNGVLEAIIEKKKETYNRNRYKGLVDYPYLHSDGYLTELCEDAQTKEECEMILEHIYHYETKLGRSLNYDSEKFIIEKFRGRF